MFSRLSGTVIAPIVTALGVFPKLRKSCSLPDRTTEEKKKRKTKTNEKLQPSNRKMSFAMKVLTLYIYKLYITVRFIRMSQYHEHAQDTTDSIK